MHNIWAIADLHLAISKPSKDMSFLGDLWKGYMEKISDAWKKVVQPEDLVLIAGDICWAMKLEEALLDLEWIDALPGTKIMIRGNHEHWWSSSKKMSASLPPSIRFIHNTAIHLNGVAIGGSRLWETQEYSFGQFIHFQENSRQKPRSNDLEKDEQIFLRELERLRLSLQQMDRHAKLKIAMTHYPPIGADLKPSRASRILEEFGVEIVVFGHLHSLKENLSLFGKSRGIQYHLTASDFLNFSPLKIL